MRSRLWLGVLFAVFACDGDSSGGGGNAGDGGSGGSAGSIGGIECYAQTEVSQTIFDGDTDSLVLAEVPEGWRVERFTMQAGYLATAVSPQDTGIPDVSVTNSALVARTGANIVTADLDPLTSVMFNGEEVTIFYQGNQPVYGVNLEGYFPVENGSDEVMRVTILASFIGSNDEQEACQDAVVTLATLVASSIRENPDWAG